MSDLTLKDLDVTNFRSIRGHIHAPLDAKVVLVHGENGAGKTSLLSAIELALTGGVQSLQRADPLYRRQLLHRSATEGSVALSAVDGSELRQFQTSLRPDGANPLATLPDPAAAFFRERTFLPQSLLGQLLQIYQDAGDGADSPLARFVGKLLGLDRLDTLEAGLKPFNDIRNVRKNVDGWLTAESEKSRLERVVTDDYKVRSDADGRMRTELQQLATLCVTLGVAGEVSEGNLDEITLAISGAPEQAQIARNTDQQRQLAAIRREIAAAEAQAPTPSSSNAEDTASQFLAWEAQYGKRFAALRERVEGLLSDASLPSEFDRFADAVMSRLRTDHKQLTDRVAQGRADIERYGKAQNERDVALAQRGTIDEELSVLSSTAGSLGSMLAELSTFIVDESCPVCDRNFTETGEGPLRDHVHAKVRTLSASAERLLALGGSRSDVQTTIERLDREIEVLETRRMASEDVADIDRRAAALASSLTELESMADALREGGRLWAANVAARRLVTEVQSRSTTLAGARQTLSDFAVAVGASDLADGETFAAAAGRLEQALATEAQGLDRLAASRRRALEHIAAVREAVTFRKQADERLASDQAELTLHEEALEKAQMIRDQANTIRGAVDKIRSAIIRREFNDRLNRLWRDLFVRLAPAEPFVPAFRIPDSGTQRLQPKLITEHRDGGEAGGTPGAMLSAGNLNTAALTLFLALHLSVPKDLPWLILDDPVQSMDDVHIAHFAALLRTLSKEHGRQVMIAVHDRQLFEYLKLELSPAFPDDSLLTLELSRGPRRDTVCVSKRFSFKEETLLTAA